MRRCSWRWYVRNAHGERSIGIEAAIRLLFCQGARGWDAPGGEGGVLGHLGSQVDLGLVRAHALIIPLVGGQHPRGRARVTLTAGAGGWRATGGGRRAWALRCPLGCLGRLGPRHGARALFSAVERLAQPQ